MHYITDKFIFCKVGGGGGEGDLMFGATEKETTRDFYFRFPCVGISVNFNR